MASGDVGGGGSVDRDGSSGIVAVELRRLVTAVAVSGSCHRARRDGRIGFVRSTGRRAVEAMLSLIGEVNGSGNRP